MFAEAFTYARFLGVKTAMGTELPMGLEPKGPEVGEDWVRGMPPELQERLLAQGMDPEDPAVLSEVYKGTFTRIMRTHPLDYYWLWGWEVWSLHGVSNRQIRAMKTDMLIAHAALEDVGAPFELALGGWILGTDDDPAKFDDTLPPEVPFVGLWDEARGFEELSPARTKWPGTWLEEDWGLLQPQLELRRLHADVKATLDKGGHGMIAKHWRTRILGANTSALKDLLWAYGPTGAPVEHAVPSSRDAWIEAHYRDWATRQFGPEAAPPIAAIFAALDTAGESGSGSVPSPLGWGEGAPGAIQYDEEFTGTWAQEKPRYAFVAELEALRDDVVGPSNLARFDYWLGKFQALRLMGEYGAVRREFDEAMEEESYARAIDTRRRLARIWEALMTVEILTVVNASDLGEIVNLEVLNWYQLMEEMWDSELTELGGIPEDANPAMGYTGPPTIAVTPPRAYVGEGETLDLTVRVMGEPTAATLFVRALGEGEFETFALERRARAVYSAAIPPQLDDFEYYIEAETPAGAVVFPPSAPALGQTVVIVPG